MPRSTSVLVALTFAACLSANAPAVAADYCITLGAPLVQPTTYVGKNFTIPKAGECASWFGQCKGCSPDNVQNGVACTASNGSQVSFGITTFYMASNRQFDWIRLDRDGTGSGNMNYLTPATPPTQNYTAKGAICPVQPEPVR